ncbi:protein NDRG2 isoform X1 [Oreochromis niloticus]|uniref:Protein NDRG2 n=2 Tax=Oreochromis TaxID=8139 RepID=A0A669BY67_ORENI|nr:protein NDRG2 isoform X1 [Oreochromis niloticus]
MTSQHRGQRWMESDGEEYRAVIKREFILREERKRADGARETFPVGQQLVLPAQQTKFDGGNTMTTEMQEIAITEDKPLLTGQADTTKDAELAARILLDQGQEHSVETPHGVLHVTLHGTRTTRRPAILTFHDVGLDSKSCFSPLFKFEEMQEIVKNFTLIHIDAPGQEEGAATYPAGYQYPSMETISEMIPAVLQFFNFRTVIGVGVGAGAYILARFALANPDAVEGLVLINIDTNARGWIDWAAQKLSSVTSSLAEQILCHLFSQEELSSSTDLVQSHRERISKAPNLSNMELLWKSYNSRRDLIFDRNSAFKCPVMLVVGDHAPYEDAAVECNSKMDPTTTSFLKMADAGGLPQLTQPAKLTEAFKYFIQGMGYMASSCMTRLSRSRTTSLSSSYSMDGSRSRSRTLSQGSQGGQMPPSPSQTMEVSC